MRVLFAILLSIFLIGGAWGYIEFAKSVTRPPVELNIDYSEGTFSVEIDRTFDCEPDPILETGSLTVKFKGNVVYQHSENLSADETILIENLTGVEVGENEIYINANPEFPAPKLSVIKVVVNWNGIPIAEKILTSDEGLGAVSGPVVFSVAGNKTEVEEDHDH